MEAMAARGFNYGVRLAGDDARWYRPVAPLGVLYRDDGHTLRVLLVLDGRRLRRLPDRA